MRSGSHLYICMSVMLSLFAKMKKQFVQPYYHNVGSQSDKNYHFKLQTTAILSFESEKCLYKLSDGISNSADTVNDHCPKTAATLHFFSHYLVNMKFYSTAAFHSFNCDD